MIPFGPLNREFRDQMPDLFRDDIVKHLLPHNDDSHGDNQQNVEEAVFEQKLNTIN